MKKYGKPWPLAFVVVFMCFVALSNGWYNEDSATPCTDWGESAVLFCPDTNFCGKLTASTWTKTYELPPHYQINWPPAIMIYMGEGTNGVTISTGSLTHTYLLNAGSDIRDCPNQGGQYETFGLTGGKATHTSTSLTLTISSSGSTYGWREIALYADECNAICKACTGPSGNECTACYNGTFLDENTCVTTCPARKYGDNTTNKCMPCHSTCYSCNGVLSTNCTACSVNYLLDSSCVICPTAGYFSIDEINNNTCHPCHPTCYTCTGGSATECTACTGNLFLYESRCRSCPLLGYYGLISENNNTCQPCDSSCRSCDASGPEDCTSCFEGSFLYNSSCGPAASCPSIGYYVDNLTNRCTKCSSTCKTCTADSQNSCLSCPTGRFFVSATSSCDISCPIGFWGDSASNICQPCNSSCATCTGPVNCTTCSSSLFYYNSMCYSNICPSGTYRDVIHMRCNPCPEGCRLCLTSYLCSECTSNYSLFADPLSDDRICMKKCPSGYYSSTSSHTCQKCHSQCVECSGANNNQCTECSSGLLLSAGQCISSSLGCPTGTYLDSELCLSCIKGCSSCSGPNNCDVCLPGYVLGIATGSCELENQELCHSSCKTCSGPTEYDCTSCNEPRFLQAHMCVRNCGLGFTLNSKTNRCEICFENCNSCLGELLYMDGYCLFSCPSGTTAVVDEQGQLSCNLVANTPLIRVDERSSGTALVALTKDVVISISVFLPGTVSSGQTSSIMINWVQTDRYAPVTRLLRGVKLNTAVLIIPKENLSPSRQYQVTPQIIVDGVVTSGSPISFTTARAIIPGGSFEITPTKGSFYDTVFTLTLNGWTAESDSRPNFTIIAYRSDNPSQKTFIATDLDLLSSTTQANTTVQKYQFTIPSRYEQQSEKDVVYTIELIAATSYDSLSQVKTIMLQALTQERIMELIETTDPASISDPSQISNFITLVAQNLIQDSELETQTTSLMMNAFDVYQTLTGDDSIQCVDAIHCSNHGTCNQSSSSVESMCVCDAGWAGRHCDKNSTLLKQAQEYTQTLLTNVLAVPPNSSSVGFQVAAMETVMKDADLIAPGSGLPTLMANSIQEAYKVAPSSAITAIAAVANTLPYQFSDELTSTEVVNMLQEVFADCIEELLEVLGIGDFSNIDTTFLYMLLVSVEEEFEEMTDDDFDNRRLLNEMQTQGTPKPRQLEELTSKSSSVSSEAKAQAQLQNKAATQSPFSSTPTVDKSKLVQVLKSLLSKLTKGRTLQSKNDSSSYSTSSGSFEIPKLTLKVSTKISFSVQETKIGQNSQASNSDTLVTRSVSFTAYDGTKELPINNLQTPIRISLPKKSPFEPSNSSTTYTCSYYDEISRMYKPDGCSFIGENLTYIICQCNHATEFAAIVNEETLSTLDSFFNKPSLLELLQLSIVSVKSKSPTFTLALQQNILAKANIATFQYMIHRFNGWPLVACATILVILLLFYPIIDFFQSIPQQYLANWEDQAYATKEFEDINKDTQTSRCCSFKEAKMFWSFYALINGKNEKYLTDRGARTLTFYAEIVNLLGNVLLWTLFFNYLKQASSPLAEICVILFSLGSSLLSFYLTLGILNAVRICQLKKYYHSIENQLIFSTSRLHCLEIIHTTICVVVILAWLVLFGVLAIWISPDDVRHWLICSSLAFVISYLVLDSLLVFLYLLTKWKRLYLFLALRTLSSDYLSRNLPKVSIPKTMSSLTEAHLKKETS